jgi:hypothetical protein
MKTVNHPVSKRARILYLRFDFGAKLGTLASKIFSNFVLNTSNKSDGFNVLNVVLLTLHTYIFVVDGYIRSKI